MLLASDSTIKVCNTLLHNISISNNNNDTECTTHAHRPITESEIVVCNQSENGQRVQVDEVKSKLLIPLGNRL